MASLNFETSTTQTAVNDVTEKKNLSTKIPIRKPRLQPKKIPLKLQKQKVENSKNKINMNFKRIQPIDRVFSNLKKFVNVTQSTDKEEILKTIIHRFNQKIQDKRINDFKLKNRLQKPSPNLQKSKSSLGTLNSRKISSIMMPDLSEYLLMKRKSVLEGYSPPKKENSMKSSMENVVKYLWENSNQKDTFRDKLFEDLSMSFSDKSLQKAEMFKKTEKRPKKTSIISLPVRIKMNNPPIQDIRMRTESPSRAQKLNADERALLERKLIESSQRLKECLKYKKMNKRYPVREIFKYYETLYQIIKNLLGDNSEDTLKEQTHESLEMNLLQAIIRLREKYHVTGVSLEDILTKVNYLQKNRAKKECLEAYKEEMAKKKESMKKKIDEEKTKKEGKNLESKGNENQDRNKSESKVNDIDLFPNGPTNEASESNISPQSKSLPNLRVLTLNEIIDHLQLRIHALSPENEDKKPEKNPSYEVRTVKLTEQNLSATSKKRIEPSIRVKYFLQSLEPPQDIERAKREFYFGDNISAINASRGENLAFSNTELVPSLVANNKPSKINDENGPLKEDLYSAFIINKYLNFFCELPSNSNVYYFIYPIEEIREKSPPKNLLVHRSDGQYQLERVSQISINYKKSSLLNNMTKSLKRRMFGSKKRLKNSSSFEQSKKKFINDQLALFENLRSLSEKSIKSIEEQSFYDLFNLKRFLHENLQSLSLTSIHFNKNFALAEPENNVYVMRTSKSYTIPQNESKCKNLPNIDYLFPTRKRSKKTKSKRDKEFKKWMLRKKNFKSLSFVNTSCQTLFYNLVHYDKATQYEDAKKAKENQNNQKQLELLHFVQKDDLKKKKNYRMLNSNDSALARFVKIHGLPKLQKMNWIKRQWKREHHHHQTNKKWHVENEEKIDLSLPVTRRKEQILVDKLFRLGLTPNKLTAAGVFIDDVFDMAREFQEIAKNGIFCDDLLLRYGLECKEFESVGINCLELKYGICSEHLAAFGFTQDRLDQAGITNEDLREFGIHLLKENINETEEGSEDENKNNSLNSLEVSRNWTDAEAKQQQYIQIDETNVTLRILHRTFGDIIPQPPAGLTPYREGATCPLSTCIPIININKSHTN